MTAKKLVVKTPDLWSILKRSKPFTSDESLPILAGVLLEAKTDSLLAVATDRYTICKSWIPAVGSPTVRALIPNSIVDRLIWLLGRRRFTNDRTWGLATSTIRQRDDTVKITSGNGDEITMHTDESTKDYPKFDKLWIPAPSQDAIEGEPQFNPRLVRRVMTAATVGSPCSPVWGKPIRIQVGAFCKPTAVFGPDEGGYGWSALIQPIRPPEDGERA